MKLQFRPVEPPAFINSGEWADWKWHLRGALQSVDEFERYFQLTDEERVAFEKSEGLFQIRVTPYYARLAADESSQGPLRRILMPHNLEFMQRGQHLLDPLGERKHSPVSRIIHRYPDRVLFLVTDLCSVYCRYCTRKHFTGKDQAVLKSSEYDQALTYIKASSGIREVILSGGDPLTLSDERLEKILSDLRGIEHVEIIRIGSRMPVVNPFRITPELVTMMKKYHPIYIMNHFNHPKELTLDSVRALSLLVDNGFPLLNQLVLLNGVNNHAAIIQGLARRLLSLRVKPYYMFQCDPSEGTEHLRTSIDESLAIQKELWGALSGLAMAPLSLDIPEGGGKAGLVPDFEIQKHESGRLYRGWDGIEAEYRNPDPKLHLLPEDLETYELEWRQIKNQSYGRDTKNSF